jgi:hypothetical protein
MLARSVDEPDFSDRILSAARAQLKTIQLAQHTDDG